jgi:hypothetical protein
LTAGYSGTPLWKKLGLKDGLGLWRDGVPDGVAAEIAESGLALDERTGPEAGLDAALVFVTARAALAERLQRLRPALAAAGMVWVCWPKKASKVATDITEDVVREEALPLGFVDVKVCAVDAVWSGLKLVIRKAARV